MVDVERFNAALKLSLIKRFFTNMDVWSEPLKRLTLQNPLIWQVGSGLSLKTNNPFWDDVLKAWDLFRLKIQLKYSEDFVNEPLWYNVIQESYSYKTGLEMECAMSGTSLMEKDKY